jgi:hypothetical protein
VVGEGVRGGPGWSRGGMPFVKVLHSLARTHARTQNFLQTEQPSRASELPAGRDRAALAVFRTRRQKRRRIDCESLCGPTPREIRAHKALWDKHTTPHDPIPIRTLSTTIVFCVFGMRNIKISPTFFLLSVGNVAPCRAPPSS